MLQKLKKIKVVSKVFWYLDPKIRYILGSISPKLLHRYLYRMVYRRKLNLNPPELFTEKLIWLMQNYNNPILVQCTDKYEVREFVEEKVGSHVLNDLYQVYDRAEDIDFEVLPEQFVLKCTHGCGCNIIVSDKSSLDQSKAVEKLTTWMNTDYSKSMGETHYSKIKPRIICERFIGTEEHDFAIDYKIWCFNGEPKFLIVNTDREKDLTFTYRDFNWNVLDYASDYYPQVLNQDKPSCLDEMLEYARSLSQGIPYVRVDFYDFKGRVVFGELTFTPAGGVPPYISFEGDKAVGNLLELKKI